jgi:hypothetical protein
MRNVLAILGILFTSSAFAAVGGNIHRDLVLKTARATKDNHARVVGLDTAAKHAEGITLPKGSFISMVERSSGKVTFVQHAADGSSARVMTNRQIRQIGAKTQAAALKQARNNDGKYASIKGAITALGLDRSGGSYKFVQKVANGKTETDGKNVWKMTSLERTIPVSGGTGETAPKVTWTNVNYSASQKPMGFLRCLL